MLLFQRLEWFASQPKKLQMFGLPRSPNYNP
jgi:hypothetical protein